MKSIENERGVVSVLLLVLLLLLGVVGGLAIFNLGKLHSVTKVTANTLSTPAITPTPYYATPAPGSDEAQILTAASAQCNTSGNTNYGATLDNAPQIVGTAAQVGVHCTGYASGQVDILKKTNDIWAIVFTGQQAPSKALGQKYALPTSWYQPN